MDVEEVSGEVAMTSPSVVVFLHDLVAVYVSAVLKRVDGNEY